MAYIANTAFEIKISNHEFDSMANITGKYQSSATDAIVSSGFLCKRSTRVVNEGYDQVGPAGSTITLNNTNTWVMVDAVDTDTAQGGIYACNPFDVNMATDGAGNMYKVGANTLSMAIPAGYLTTWTRIHFDNDSVYRFGVGNLSAALSTNTFCTIDDGLLVPGASAPATAGTPYFKLVGSGTFTEGAYASFGYVDVQACIAE